MSEARVALVTGAARGIGAATVAALVKRGLRVIALDGCAGEVSDVGYPMGTREELAALATAYDDRVLLVVADVRDRSQLDAAVAAGLEKWGRLDVAVAAAAVITGGRPLWETSAEELHELWAVDVAGVWNTAAATVPHLLASPDPGLARFVAVASAAGARGLFHLSAYTTVKHAVVGIVRGLAADLVGTGVSAVAVSPGATGTRMLDATAAIYGVPTQELAQSQLLRTTLDPREVAATIAFCCSPEGRVLNGSVVAADGGFSG